MLSKNHHYRKYLRCVFFLSFFFLLFKKVSKSIALNYLNQYASMMTCKSFYLAIVVRFDSIAYVGLNEY